MERYSIQKNDDNNIRVTFKGNIRSITNEDMRNVQRDLEKEGFKISMKALEHNAVMWEGDLKSGYRDTRNKVHVFSPCGCNPMAYLISRKIGQWESWQTTYFC